MMFTPFRVELVISSYPADCIRGYSNPTLVRVESTRKSEGL
jgi:hypothetical protein